MAASIRFLPENFAWSLLCRGLFLSKTREISHKYSSSHTNVNEENETSSSSSDSDSEDKSDLRLKILKEAMKHVPEHGWSKEAIVAGVTSLGLPGVAHGMLSKGGADLVFYFNSSSNEKLESILKEKELSATNKTNEISTAFLSEAIKARLEMIIPYAKRWPEAMALMALPQHVLHDMQHLRDLVDIIWYYSGDKNVYMKWYTRRLSLAGLYKISELYLSQDTSEDFADTWLFLDHRVEELVESDISLSEMQNSCNTFKEVGEGAFITVKNMLGLNSRFR